MSDHPSAQAAVAQAALPGIHAHEEVSDFLGHAAAGGQGG